MATDKKIIGFQAPMEVFERLREIGAPSGTPVSQLVRMAVYEKYIQPTPNNGDTPTTPPDEKSDRKSA